MPAMDGDKNENKNKNENVLDLTSDSEGVEDDGSGERVEDAAALGVFTRYYITNAGFVYRIVDDHYDNDDDDDANDDAGAMSDSTLSKSVREEILEENREDLRDLGIKFPGDPDER
jgi:hypothetical protein